MRFVFALVLLLGIGLAGGAVDVAQGYIEQTQAEAEQLRALQARAPRLIDVVVAKTPMKYGQRFTAADLQTIKWPIEQQPEGAYNYIVPVEGMPADAKVIFAAGETRPRAALRSFEPFEPILAAKVTNPGVDAGITANLEPGMRAFTIPVNQNTGVAGFLRPGSRVDVYWSGRVNDRGFTQLIESGLTLIAIDQNADADRTEETVIARTVTVAATPEQVAALQQAQSSGSLSLSLLGDGAPIVESEVIVDTSTVLNLPEEEAPAPVVEEETCYRTERRGAEITRFEVPCN